MPKEYQIEPQWLRDTIWARGAITPLELLRICAWKSAAGGNLALLSLNSETEISEKTAEALVALAALRKADAFDKHFDWDAWEAAVRAAIGSESAGTGLLGLRGVGYPTATAVLCIANPEAFPVMDKWTIRGVFGPGARPRDLHNAASYRDFAQRLVAINHQYGLSSIHAVDQRVMNTLISGEALQFETAPPERER